MKTSSKLPIASICLENKFENWMTWENHGKEWHIDHIIPLKYNDPSIDELCERLHYLNTQPLRAFDNISKNFFERIILKKY